MPTFSGGGSELLLRTARSVLAQSLADLELVIVDDASTGGAARGIWRLMAEDDRVSCLRHPQSVGLPAVAAYEAFRKARANYLLTVLDDGELCRDAIRGLLTAAVRRRCSSVHGHVQGIVYDRVAKRYSGGILGGSFDRQSKLRGWNFLPDKTVLLHRRVVETVGFYDPHAAMTRLFDWDLWRRVADAYPIQAVPVLVERKADPPLLDSPATGPSLDAWQGHEWMETPRNERLRPGAIEEYDVLAAPGGLSGEAVKAVEEISDAYCDRFRHPQAAVHQLLPSPRPCSVDTVGATAGRVPFGCSSARNTVGQANRGTRQFRSAGAVASPAGDPSDHGRLLVVTTAHDASTTLYFDHLPAALHNRVRIVYPDTHGPEEMAGASAVVFVRDALKMSPWIDYAQWVGIPCYYFLDDNFVALGELGGDFSYLRPYTDDALRRRLRGFAGVLLSTHALIDYFRRRRLHSNQIYYPPIARKPAWKETPPAPPKPAGTTRIAFFGGSHRLPALQEQVFPAIAEIAREHPVELFAAGMDEGSAPVPGNLKTVCFPHDPSYDIALARMTACEIDLLVHPNSDTPNDAYKTCNVLISAWAMGAVPLVSDAPPYTGLAGRNVAVLCGRDPRSWRDAVRGCAEDPRLRESLRRDLDAYCLGHYGGRENVAVLQVILESHPAAGAALCKLRRRRGARFAAAQWRRELLGRIGSQLSRRIANSLPGRAVRRLRPMLGLRPAPELHEMIAPAFRPLLENPLAKGWLRDGYRLRVSRDLRKVPYLVYPLDISVQNIRSVLLAAAMGPPATRGRIGIQLAAPDGEVLAESSLSPGDIDPSLPLEFEFPPIGGGRIAGRGRGLLWLRVYDKGLTEPLRLLHWSKRRRLTVDEEDVRAFCAFRFRESGHWFQAEGPAVHSAEGAALGI
jgi:hypothetical protein